MIITRIAENCCENTACARNTGRALDWAIALTLLVVGILAAVNVIHLPVPVTYAFIGAGVVYTVGMIIHETLLLSCGKRGRI